MMMAAGAQNVRLRLVDGPAAASTSGRIADLDDAQLVALARANDLHAFEALYRRYAAFAINLAVRIQGSAADVEDIAHDSFVRAHERLGELRDAGAFRSWLGAIVVRFVRSRLRKRRLMAYLGLATGEAADLEIVASPEAGPDTRALLAQVYALLRTMAPEDRIAWTLRHVERYQLEEVARLAGCSLATAKRRIARAQRFLNDHFVAPYLEQSQYDASP